MDTRLSLIDLLSDIQPTDGQTANTLLSEFFRGRPIIELAPALRSSDDKVMKHALWITSELGKKAVVLLPAVHHLLRHNSPYVRCLALDVVNNCASTEHGKIVATALLLLSDEIGFVRKSVYYYTAKSRADVLQSGIRHIQNESLAVPVPILTALPWLFTLEASDPVQVKSATQSLSFSQKVVGIIAAARLGERGIDILTAVEANGDEGLQGFIHDWTEDAEEERAFDHKL